MKICLIAEGSYPFVAGGVSSWMQSLMKSMPEHEFIVFAIGAEAKDRGVRKYEKPENLLEIKEIFLDELAEKEAKWGKKLKFSIKEKHMLKKFISGEPFSRTAFFEFVEAYKEKNPSEILMSKDFYDIVKETAEEKYRYISFNGFFWTIRSILITLLEVLRSDLVRADLYHSVSTGYSGIIGAYLKYLYGTPYVLTEHGIYSREREEEIIKCDWVKGNFKEIWIKYFYSLSQVAYESADKVICLYEGAKEIQQEIGCEKDKIKVIPNGISLDGFKDVSSKNEDSNIINIGAIVRLVPIKDIKTMLKAFAYVKKEVPQVNFFVMGPHEENPEYATECIELAESLGLGKEIFTGRVNIKDYIGKMDILTLGSISEGQPLSVLEGMAAGKCHVVTDVGSCKELIYGVNDGIGEAGKVVPVMNHLEFGKALVLLAKNEALRNIMGENGRKRVSAFYKYDDFIESYKKIYNSFEEV